MSGGFGAVPDMFMGKKPEEAILSNLAMAAAVGATGGMAAPGLLGAEAVGGSMASMAEQAAMNSAIGQQGLFSGLKTMGSAIKPIGDAAGAAGSVGGLFADRSQPIQHAQMQPSMGGSQIFAQLAAQGPQEQQAQMQADAQRRQRRMGLLGVQ